MKPFILSDSIIYRLKDKFEKEMTMGLERPDKATLPMTVTFVTERFTSTEGDYVAICAHAHNFTITLVKLKNSSPEIQRKNYNIDILVFQQSYRKIPRNIYETFAECVKDFFYEFQLDGKIIPVEINISGIYHAEFDAKYLGSENVLGLDVNSALCHKILEKMKVFLDAGRHMQDIFLDIGHSGIQIRDKAFKDLLHHHPLNKVSHITQDFMNSCIFGYIFGDYVKGHQFFGFKTTCKSTQVLLFLQELFQVELMQRKKEELDMKASQVFLTLKNFLNVAQDLKAKEREIPITLKKHISLVENIFWWLEGCSGDITPAYLEPEEWTLNVRLQELYTTAVTLKLIEKEQEEEARIKAIKASKRHLRKATEKVDYHKQETRKKLPPSSNMLRILEILKEHAAFFKSIQENRKQKVISLEENIAKLNYYDVTEALGAVISLDKISMKIDEQTKTEIFGLKQKIESIISMECSERENLQFEQSHINFGSRLFLKSIQMKPNENTFEKVSLNIPERSLEVSEISNQIKMCKEYFLNALKIRREEIDELNYFINCLHFREHHLPSKECSVVVICRQLLVKSIKMRLREVRSAESILIRLNDVEEDIVFAVPEVYRFCKDIYTSFLQKLEDKYNLFQAITLKIPDVSGFDVYLLQDYKELYQELKQLEDDDVQKVEETISKLRDREHFIDIKVFSLCSKLFKDAVENRKKEFDKLVNDLDLLEATEIDDIDNEDIEMINNCRNIFLTSIVLREKEIEYLENGMRKSYDFSAIQGPEVLVSVRDIFYAALELEKKRYEKVLFSESEKCDKMDEILPVVYTLKDIFDVISIELKQKQNQKSDDPTTAKTFQIYTSLEEFLSMAFELKQTEIEIPVEVLKKDLERILSSMIGEVKDRENQRILEHKRHLQALKIMNSWKEVFLMAARLRKAEIMTVVPAKIKESKEEEIAMKTLRRDERLSVDNEGRQVGASWRRIFCCAIDMKRKEVEQIKKLLMKLEEHTVDEKVEEIPIFIDVNENEYFEEEEDAEDENPYSELLRVMDICRLIFQIVIKKGTTELEEIENDMRPIFNHEYDEENIELEVDEITSVLNKTKQVLQDFSEISKEREAVLTTSIETLSFLQENIRSQVSVAQETAKRFLLVELEEGKSEMLFIQNNVEMLDVAFEGLISKPSEKLRPFTDLVVDVLNSEETNVYKEKQDKNPDVQPESTEGEKSPVFTREQIESLLLEIELDQKGDDEEKEDPQKLKALDRYQSCRKFLLSVAEFRNKNIEILESKLEKIEKLEQKKLKKKKQISRATSNVSDCKDILNNMLEIIQTEVKFMQDELYEISKAYPVEQETTEFKSSDIVSVFRKLFSSFVDVRRNNLYLMNVELEMLEANKNSFSIENGVDETVFDTMKTKILAVCKDLVIGSVDLKMKEVDEITSQLDLLNETEQKIDTQLNQLDTEEMKASYTKLEKVKDAVSTCKRLCISAGEKAKKGVRAADEELEMLKDVLDASEDSVVRSTCISLLQTNIDCKGHEIFAMKKVFNNLKDYMNSTEVTEEEMLDYLNSLDSEALPTEEKSSLEQIIASKASSEVVFTSVEDTENPSAEKIINKVNQKKTISPTDLGEQVKDTIKLEKDTEVFDICNSAILHNAALLRMESQTITNELQNLNKINIKDIENTEDVEFAATCKRILVNGVKNRKSQCTRIEFELLKLVRYQDSRITRMCKDELIYLQESLNKEIQLIKEKVKRLERSYKLEILEICKRLFQDFLLLVNNSINLTESILQSITEKKMKIELEDAQFVSVCKDLFHLHVAQRKKEIALKRQAIDQIYELKLTTENLDAEVDNVYKMCKTLCDLTIATRYNEIEGIECELIKQMNIKVSDSTSECEQYFFEITETLKNHLQALKKETEEIQNLRVHFWKMKENEFFDLITKYKNFILSHMQKNILDEKLLTTKINIFKGKQDCFVKVDEVNMDILNAQEGSRKKLQTECNPATGECQCPPGWKGDDCSMPCPNGKFGLLCKENCSCLNGGYCRRNDGVCRYSPGWMGPRCTQMCLEGYYGDHCMQQCQCKNENYICNSIS
ncbi:PID domain-containing protein [Nephila pilipes]|uniref:PID domain-containing protein n=1 Tax=Nephila pilipes TaxID=299642 RepID=A0A8X6UH03_NEPPI|nr:PID domain-containing protein [Nephila pilipes]